MWRKRSGQSAGKEVCAVIEAKRRLEGGQRVDERKEKENPQKKR